MDDEASAAVAQRWIDAWTAGDTSALFGILAAGAPVESNLDPDGDFVEILTSYAAALDAATVFSLAAIGNRVAIVYDCTVRAETFRLAEFLDIGEDRLIHGVRRVYDLSAVHRLIPALLDES
jgi:hypothetical protein